MSHSFSVCIFSLYLPSSPLYFLPSTLLYFLPSSPLYFLPSTLLYFLPSSPLYFLPSTLLYFLPSSPLYFLPSTLLYFLPCTLLSPQLCSNFSPALCSIFPPALCSTSISKQWNWVQYNNSTTLSWMDTLSVKATSSLTHPFSMGSTLKDTGKMLFLV